MHGRTPAILAVVGLVACTRTPDESGGSGSAHSEDASTPSSRAVAPESLASVVADPPVLAGSVDVEISGARTRSIDGTFGECLVGPDGSVNFTVYESDLETVAPDRTRSWTLGAESTASGEYAVFLQEFDLHSPGAVVTFDRVGRAPPGLAKPQAEPASLVLDLVRKDGVETIHLEGTVRCPVPDAGSRVPDPIVHALAQISGEEPRPFLTFDFGREHDPRGVSVVVAAAAAHGLVARLRGVLPKGFTAFVGFNDVMAARTEVVVVPVHDQFDILRWAKSNAANYGIMTEGLVRTLRRWDEQHGIEIVGATTDTIELKLVRIPRPAAVFAREVNAFCPDIVSQGVGTVTALAEAIESGTPLVLWWD